MRSLLAVTLALLALTAGLGFVGSAAAVGEPSASTLSTGSLQAPLGGAGAVPDGQGNVTMELQPRADGDARWTVVVSVRLTSENETAAFRRLGREYAAGSAETGFGADTFERAAAEASNATGREMRIVDVSRDWSLEDAPPANESGVNASTGRLELRFTWTNFAVARDDRVHVGDAFNTTAGTWLPRLSAGQTLVLEAPPGFGVTSAPTGFDDGTIRFEGPREFSPGYLSVTYRRGAGTSGDGDLPPSGLGLSGLVPFALVGVVLVSTAALGAYAWGRRTGHDASLPGPLRTVTDGHGPAAAEASEAAEPAPDPDPEPDPVDEELLSDEELVEHLLDRNGGRMKQADIVRETGWSNAKVSQLLSAMHDDDRVGKLRIGRENLITLPDEDVGDARED